jgi:hypothetical protein
MKKITTLCTLAAALIFSSFIFQGCIKDTVSRTYTMYIPVYKTSAEVRANIKNDVPAPVKNPGKMFVLGNYIYLNEIDKGIHIIDNTNPSAPVNKYFINIPGNVDLAVTGNTLYADLYTDLVTLDISDPSSVQVKKITGNVFPFRRYTGNFIADTTKVITEWIKKDTTVTNGLNDFQVFARTDAMFALSSASQSAGASSAITTGISGSMARFTLLNNYLYTVTDNALNVFNISQPQNPVFTNKVTIGSGIETIYPFKNNLFIGSTTGMVIYSAANPAQPVQLGTFTHARRCDPVIADEDYAYVTLRGGGNCGGVANELNVVDIKNIQSTKLIKSYPLTNPYGLSKDGNTLFICDGTAGLKVYDATDVNNLKLLQTVSGINTYDVITVNGIAIVVAKDGLYQYDYSNRNNVQLRSKISYN